MSTRIYVYRTTDKQIEVLAKYFNISKAEVVEIAINTYYRKLRSEK